MKDDVQFQFAVLVTVYQFRRHAEILYAALRTGIEIDAPFDAAVFPVVLPFQVRAVAVTEYFYGKLVAAFFQQSGDVEVRRQTAVFGISGKFAVHPYIVGGLHSFEIEEDVHACPACRYGKLADVGAYGVIVGRHMRRVGLEGIARVGVDGGIEPLQFPTAGNFYLAPFAGVVSRFVEVFGA